MCPSTACGIDEIGAFVTDEQLIAHLESIQNQSPEESLPRNVVAGINPYLDLPKNLSELNWYVVHSKDPKQSELGLWKAKGDPCQIWSESSVIGWRTTLEFYEGCSPNENLTDWVMQEYSMSHKGSDKEKGCSSLCRVFRCDREVDAHKMDQHQVNDDAGGQQNLINDDLNKSDMPLMSKVQEEMERYQDMPFHQGNNLLQADCFEDGDYLELRDLFDPPSSSSTSETSSCVSCSSEYFDSAAFLHELDREVEVCQTNPVSSPAEEAPTTSDNNIPIEPDRVEGADPVLTLKRQLHGKDPIPENTRKRRPPPVSDDAGASSSRQISGSDRGKKAPRGKIIKKFFCFLAF